MENKHSSKAIQELVGAAHLLGTPTPGNIALAAVSIHLALSEIGQIPASEEAGQILREAIHKRLPSGPVK